MSRLGRNHGGYRGERIDPDRVILETVGEARRRGWLVDVIGGRTELGLFALRRGREGACGGDGPGERVGAMARRVYISTGIHGDEPAGPLAVQRLIREDGWPRELELWLCPCLNPAGFRENRRENAQGTDLNRDYRNPVSPEVRAHIGWLERQPPFELSICVHEDWEAHGFYLYELNPDGRPSPAEQAIRDVAEVCPIDPSPVIEGREAHTGVIRPVLNPAERLDWPEALYLIEHKTRHSFTLEAPSDFPLETRVRALVRAVRVLLNWPGEPRV